MDRSWRRSHSVLRVCCILARISSIRRPDSEHHRVEPRRIRGRRIYSAWRKRADLTVRRRNARPLRPQACHDLWDCRNWFRLYRHEHDADALAFLCRGATARARNVFRNVHRVRCNRGKLVRAPTCASVLDTHDVLRGRCGGTSAPSLVNRYIRLASNSVRNWRWILDHRLSCGIDDAAQARRLRSGAGRRRRATCS